MKKLLKKLKKNQLLSKIAALFTICMILLSSFTVSSFAADEDEFTNSITEVWTGVTDSIFSLFGSAQGVFFGSGDFVSLQYGTPISLLGSQLYPILNFPNADVGDELSISYLSSDDPVPFPLIIYDSSYDFESGLGFTKVAVVFEGQDSFPIAFYQPSVLDSTYDGWYSVYPLDAVISSSFSLTFLGTLAVIGVAFSIILLLVFVISRFIHLRG